MACLLAAPEGIEKFSAAHPDVPIFTAAIDSHLDEVRAERRLLVLLVEVAVLDAVLSHQAVRACRFRDGHHALAGPHHAVRKFHARARASSSTRWPTALGSHHTSATESQPV